jgi:hypothetical protein
MTPMSELGRNTEHNTGVMAMMAPVISPMASIVAVRGIETPPKNPFRDPRQKCRRLHFFN